MDLDQKEVQSLSLSIRSAIAAALDGPGKLVSSTTYIRLSTVLSTASFWLNLSFTISVNRTCHDEFLFDRPKKVTVFNDNTKSASEWEDLSGLSL